MVTPLSGRAPRTMVKLWDLIAVIWTLLIMHPTSTVAQEQLLAAVGSSVLLSAPAYEDGGIVQWSFHNGGETQAIGVYFIHTNDLNVRPHYSGRVDFFPANGSLLLKNVRKEDSGLYKVLINLGERQAKRIALTVIGPVPPPQIRFNVDPLLLSAELVCEVSADEVDSIEWKKDGAPLPDSPLYQIKDRSQLYIGNVEKSDCATFSCNASNRLYWNESSSPLMFEGIPPVMWAALWLSAAALGVAIYCLLCFVVQFLKTKERKWITGRLWCIWTVPVQALVCIASLLLLVATIIWMTDRGASGTFILLSKLLLFVMAVTALSAVILACYPDKLAFFKSKRVCKVIIDSAAPGGVLLIVLFSSFLIHDIHTLRGEGCPPAIYQKAISIVLPFVLLFLLLLCPCTCWWFHRRIDLEREAEAGMRPQGADPEAQSEQQMQVLVQGVVAENPSRHIEDEAEETGAGHLGD